MMTQEEILLGLQFFQNTVESDTDYEIFDVAIKSVEQRNKILQILDDCELEAWEVLEKIKEVVRV